MNWLNRLKDNRDKKGIHTEMVVDEGNGRRVYVVAGWDTAGMMIVSVFIIYTHSLIHSFIRRNQSLP